MKAHLLLPMEWMLFALLVIGAGLNMFATHANGGKMPVATMADQVSFSIGVYTKENFPYYGNEYFVASDTHQPLTKKTRYAFLSDHIAYSFEYPIFDYIPKPIRYILSMWGLPLGTHMLASPGDFVLWFMIWIASPIAVRQRLLKHKRA